MSLLSTPIYHKTHHTTSLSVLCQTPFQDPQRQTKITASWIYTSLEAVSVCRLNSTCLCNLASKTRSRIFIAYSNSLIPPLCDPHSITSPLCTVVNQLLDQSYGMRPSLMTELHMSVTNFLPISKFNDMCTVYQVFSSEIGTRIMY